MSQAVTKEQKKSIKRILGNALRKVAWVLTLGLVSGEEK